MIIKKDTEKGANNPIYKSSFHMIKDINWESYKAVASNLLGNHTCCFRNFTIEEANDYVTWKE